MGTEELKTIPDDGRARDQARDDWVRSCEQHFLVAFRMHRDSPGPSLAELRKVLEGWAHAVCIEREATFRINDGPQKYRGSLAEVLKRARQHVPASRRDLALLPKALGDDSAHNQGDVQETSSLVARGALLHVAELMRWLYADVLRKELPPELQSAIAALDGTSPVSGVPQTGHQLGSRMNGGRLLVAGAALFALAGFGLLLAMRSSDVLSAKADALGSRTALSPTAGLASSSAPMREDDRVAAARMRLGGYFAAVHSGVVDEIVSFHALPTARLYLGLNLDRPRLVELYTMNPPKAVLDVDSLDACKLASKQPIAFLCTAGAPECVVFDESLKISARYNPNGKWGQPTTCPP